jgi:cytochrome P450
MLTTTGEGVYYDPYDEAIYADPYPVYRRMREEAPLYYNERYGFWALSRYEDVEPALVDHATFSSAWGDVLEMITSGAPLPKGFFICEDPPLHTAHRGVLSRVFTPKKMSALEPQIREFCARHLDPLVGAERFDFVTDLGAKMPIAVIGILLGIPEQDQQAVRARGGARTRRESGKPKNYEGHNVADPTFFGDYIDWRAENPSDDLMTQLIQVEFEDPTTGMLRRLTREEILTFVNMLSNAGNETTNRLIGWAGKLLSDHPDQRRALVGDPSLIPNAVEEIVRYEPPGHQACRVATRDVVYYGQTVPAGSPVMFIFAAANRDSLAFPPDGDTFDALRGNQRHHLSFGFGIHFCLGAALARLEVRVALEEVLRRFPDWEVDADRARLEASVVRGWATLPVVPG